MNGKSSQSALNDIRAAIVRYPLAGMLGWQDVRQRYRRSSLGPFWLTISMGVMIGTIGFVFGQIFQSPTHEYLPFLTVGIILWGFISSCVSEGCNSFISSESIIKQLPIPLFVHIQRTIWRNTIIFMHNLVIFPVAFYITGNTFSINALLSILGMLVLIINMSWVSFLLAILCSRYRDLTQIVNSVLQVVFYLTPIMWMPSLLPDRLSSKVLVANPVFHLIEIVRAPLLGNVPTAASWIVSLGIAVIGWIVTLAIYGKCKHRIAYWV